MDIMRLDSSTFLPISLLEYYDSINWTERFTSFGEFQFVTRDIQNVMNQFPVGSFLACRDSVEVMMVENHSIEGDLGQETLTVSGRSIFAMYMNRDVREEYVYLPTGSTNYTEGIGVGEYFLRPVQGGIMGQDVFILWLLYNNIVANEAGYDIEYSDRYVQGYASSLLPIYIGSSVSGTVSSVDNPTAGLESRYDYIIKMMEDTGFGIRTVRPGVPRSNTLVTFDNAGTPTYQNYNAVSKPVIELYSPVDRSIGSSNPNGVLLDARQGHVRNAKYLFSNENLKNSAILSKSRRVDGNLTRTTKNGLDPDSSSIYSGWNYRPIFIDGTEIQYRNSNSVYSRTLWRKGQNEIATLNKTFFFDSEASPDIPYKFGSDKNKGDYNMGDYITVQGKYGISVRVQVVEFTRAEDEQGERAWPTVIQKS